MASLEKSRNSLQTGVGTEPLFMLRCDWSPVMLTLFSTVENFLLCGRTESPGIDTVLLQLRVLRKLKAISAGDPQTVPESTVE
jgi:hypothetical protein